MPSFQVVEFHPDQTIIETTRTPEQLHLQPRDISIFATNKLGVQAQRATISPRNGAVLFRTEIAKAIIYKDRAVLFHSRQASLVQSGACLVSMPGAGGGQLQNLCKTSSVGVQSLLTSGASHVSVTSGMTNLDLKLHHSPVHSHSRNQSTKPVLHVHLSWSQSCNMLWAIIEF